MGVLYPAFAQQAQHVKAAALAKGQALLEQALSQPSFAEAAQRYADTCGRYSQARVSGVCRHRAMLPGLQSLEVSQCLLTSKRLVTMQGSTAHQRMLWWGD